MARLCVYLGSRQGQDPAFAQTARTLGHLIAEGGHTLVYGGARVGLMGILADSALNHGGKVIGVMPDHLVASEQAHSGLDQLLRVDNMHDRKATMALHADAFVALPGGIGTLEELFEIWTWGYLGLHDKPLGLLNVNNFFTPLLTFLDNTVKQGLLAPSTRKMLLDDTSPKSLIKRLTPP